MKSQLLRPANQRMATDFAQAASAREHPRLRKAEALQWH